MSRPLRIEYAGAIYHITSRGNAREPVFFGEADRNLFLETLARVTSRMGWRCHAYCLMTNHYHLVIETPNPNLARGMRQLNGVYTQSMNRRHQRVGHLFQGRYGSIVLQRDTHLLAVCRYVVLNPVRTALVKRPEDWKWSNYTATAGMTLAPPWLTTDWTLSLFGKNRAAACRAYRDFVCEGIARPTSLWNDLRQQVILGGEPFVRHVTKKAVNAGDLAEIPQEQIHMPPHAIRWYQEHCRDRQIAMARAHLEGGYRLKHIADHFGVHYSTVSRAVKRYEQDR